MKNSYWSTKLKFLSPQNGDGEILQMTLLGFELDEKYNIYIKHAYGAWIGNTTNIENTKEVISYYQVHYPEAKLIAIERLYGKPCSDQTLYDLFCTNYQEIMHQLLKKNKRYIHK